MYQDDIYPDAVGKDPALEACEWFEGKNVEPLRMDMKTRFVSKEKKSKSGGGGLKKGGLKGLKAKKKEGKEESKPVKEESKPVKENSKSGSTFG